MYSADFWTSFCIVLTIYCLLPQMVMNRPLLFDRV